MAQSYRRAFGTACVVLFVSVMGSALFAAELPPAALKVEKIYFMIHPTCWQSAGSPSTPPAGWTEEPKRGYFTAFYNRELRVNRAQKELMERMRPNEVLVLFPVGNCPAMQDLDRHATKTLGRRAIIVRRGGKAPGCKNAPPAWGRMPSWVDRFLDDPKLEGRAEFLAGVPQQVQEELATEIRTARKAIGSDWSIAVLKVIYFSRLCAMDLEQEFKDRNLHYDPATVQSEAFGESFEGCAVTWKQMLVPYLGLANPPPSISELSVSDTPFLATAKLIERVKLSDDVYLYLWDGGSGRTIAEAIRAWCRLKDSPLFLRVPLAGLSAVVCDSQSRQLFPKPDSPELALKVTDGHLELPVLKAIRREQVGAAVARSGELPCYLIADGVSVEEFRKRLITAPIHADDRKR